MNNYNCIFQDQKVEVVMDIYQNPKKVMNQIMGKTDYFKIWMVNTKK